MRPRDSEYGSSAPPPPSRHRDHNPLLQHARGPVPFLNPTQGLLRNAGEAPIKRRPSLDGIHFLWRSRDNRKGRHPLRLPRRPDDGGSVAAPRPSSHPKEVLRGIIRTLTQFPVWDISWLVAFIFTAGSIVWVINGFFAWLPLVHPSTSFQGETDYGGGITAFIGAIIFFEVGSLLLILEAVNTNDASCFGWAVKELVDPDTHRAAAIAFVASKNACRHHHQNKHNLVGRAQRHLRPVAETAAATKHWRWCPSWHDLHHRYVYELGFLAGAAQLFGATVFGVAGFTALPGIAGHLTPQWRLNAAYWIPQVVGGCGFIVSGLLYMLETQDHWWRPATRLLGWHIAFWNLVGAVGFTLCGALGMAYGSTGAQYQAALATFWGSWAFLIGSYLQLYESLNKHPVEQIKSKPTRKRLRDDLAN
ncbi:hypothetical protein ARSEF4850_005998 [Beauveria asiatica]